MVNFHNLNIFLETLNKLKKNKLNRILNSWNVKVFYYYQ